MIGLFLKGVICIDFAHFCKGIYGSVEGVANQDSFVVEVFKAAGSSYAFTKKGAYSTSNYGAKLFNGGKPLSKKHRDSFPNPTNTTGLAKFLSEHIKKASARTVMNYFTIPTDADNRSYFEALEVKAEKMAKKYDCAFVDNEMPYGRVPQGHPVIVDYFYHEEIRGTENTGKRNR